MPPDHPPPRPPPARPRRAVITGMGAVSPIGVGVAAYTAALRRGESGVGLLPFEDERMRSTVGAKCTGFDAKTVLSDADIARVPRCVPMALAACLEAGGRAGLLAGDRLHPGLGPATGLVLGTGAGGIDFTLDQAAAGYSGRRASLWTITNATHGNLAGELAIRLGVRGRTCCVSTGCASASDAVGTALDWLGSDRPGAPSVVIVVGADAHIRWETLYGMELLRVISTRDWRADPGAAATASRPFDASRDGFVLGEGAWAVVLEREGSAGRREVEPVGAVLGYGATSEAFHRVRPDPDPGEAARAMRLAVEDAGLRPEEVELIQYHGTGTPVNDAQETAAVKLAFGDHARRLRGSSIKSMIGHPQGACGLASLVGMVGAMRGEGTEARGHGGTEGALRAPVPSSLRLSAAPSLPFIPPTINLHEPDPACDLDYTPNEAAPTGARVALINCSAFGSRNSAIVIRV